jgi:iron(III) transport system permease protein
LFLPLTVVAVRNAIEQSTPRVEEVAKSLGASPLATIARVTVPLALPGILAGGAMTMLSAVKELPTTLLLRPTGTETLATSIWKYSSVSDYASVGPFAIALMILAVVPVAVMTVMSSRSPK